MAEVTSLKIGLATPLPNGGEVFGVLAENADYTCFELTAPDGLVTRFALSLDALAAMVDIAMKLRSPDGVSALPTPKPCPGCAQYHGRNDCPVGWRAPAEPYGVPASEYLAKIEADPRRAAALQRARDRTPGVKVEGGNDAR